MSIKLKQTSNGHEKSFSLHGMTENDVLLLALAIKPFRKQVAQELESLQNPTIQSLRETGVLIGNNKEVQLQISARMMEFSQALNSSATKIRSNVHTD